MVAGRVLSALARARVISDVRQQSTFPSTKAEVRRVFSSIGAGRPAFCGDPNIVHPKLTPQLDSTVRMAEQLGSLPILGGNRVEFLADTQLVIDRLIADIDRAENHVHLLFYIFSDDDTGKQVMDALGRAKARGVQCRLLVDSVGSWRSIRSLAAKSKAFGIEMYEMLPVGVFRRRIARFDLRNHRKLAVIDGRIAYTGSQNIVNADYGRKNMAWHDMMVRLTGPISIELQAVFVTDWYLESGQMLGGNAVFASPELDGSVAAQTLPSGPIFPVENYQRLVVSAHPWRSTAGDHYDALFCSRRTAPAGHPDRGLAGSSGRLDCPEAM
jgi:cardiolipin synthase